jgi:hypothetical protein
VGATVPVALPDGSTGTIPANEAPLLQEGSRVLTPQEHAAAKADIAQKAEASSPGGFAKNYADTSLSGVHSLIRGEGEAVGLPVDRAITGIADYFGGRKQTADYLKGLDERHPVVSGITGVQGNVAGALGAMAALKSPAAGMRGLAGVAARAGIGGVETVVQATTKDVNEAALGDHEVNGEKLLAAAPGRFLTGAAFSGAFEGGAAILGKGISAARPGAVAALEGGAAKAVGRDVGLAGDDAAVAGRRIMDLSGGVPKSKAGIAEVLGAEQVAQRGRAVAAREGTLDALAGTQATEAAGLSARQEAARGAAARQGRDVVQGAEWAGAEDALGAMGRDQARMGEAELTSAFRTRTARTGLADAEGAAAGARQSAEEAFHAEMVAAHTPLRQVEEHYGALRQAVGAERATAVEVAEALKVERIANAHELQKALLAAESKAGIKNAEARAARELENEAAMADIASGKAEAERLRAAVPRAPTKEDLIALAKQGKIVDAMMDDGRGNMVAVKRWVANEGAAPVPGAQGKVGYGMRAADEDAKQAEAILAKRVDNAAAVSSKSTSDEVLRYRSLSDQLKTAHEDALAHVRKVEAVAADTETKAVRDITAAQKGAEARATAAFRASVRPVAEDAAVAKATERIKVVEAEVAKSVEAAKAIGSKEAAEAEKRGAVLIAKAQKEANAINSRAAKVAGEEKVALNKTHDAQIKAVPAASEATDVDHLVAGIATKSKSDAERPVVSNPAVMGAVFSVLHGNPMAAAGGLVSSFAAGQARARGNLVAARAMVALSKSITAVDKAVQNGTLAILGKSAGRAAGATLDAASDDEPKTPSFEAITKDLYAVQGNPQILERRVSAALGDVANVAPQTYTQTLASTQRAHDFLLSILPPSQTDPNSLTPQIDRGAVDASTKYEFMRSFSTVQYPLRIYKDVQNGTVTEQQMDAIKAVYPTLYDAMRDEVNHVRTTLTEPVDYEREIHIGTLMGIVTNEVLEPDFQDLQAKAYEDKETAGSPAGSKPSSADSKSSKSMMSGSESVEGGHP